MEKGDPSDTVVALSSILQKYDSSNVEHILKDSFVQSSFYKDEIKDILDILTSKDSLNILFASKTFDFETTAPWFHTPYEVSENSLSINKHLRGMDLPPKNPLIPKDLTILDPIEEYSDKPTLLKSWGSN